MLQCLGHTLCSAMTSLNSNCYFQARRLWSGTQNFSSVTGPSVRPISVLATDRHIFLQHVCGLLWGGAAAFKIKYSLLYLRQGYRETGVWGEQRMLSVSSRQQQRLDRKRESWCCDTFTSYLGLRMPRFSLNTCSVFRNIFFFCRVLTSPRTL